ncbi:hypothetical protein [Sphingobium sp.]|uniref:hypothetical protein n=1 Tax=Sphingobium sp. TaxID=1912891 RepID=UPI000DB5B523|nr:hypothetical protein [Sphingobium sp.]PZU63222.1 MAG: hypothetical protein DI540_24445 [Sphingobium sp.]
MQNVNVMALLSATSEIARLHQILSSLTDAHSENLNDDSVQLIAPRVQNFREEADRLGAKIAVRAANRAIANLKAEPCTLTLGDITAVLKDIESRFADHLVDISMIALTTEETIFLQNADALIEIDGFAISFPRTSFEVEEAAKCIALGRHTAAVFHAMRMLELGIKALAKRLAIDDPTKPAEKNWAFILKAVKAKIDELYPANQRMPGSEGAEFEALYANLDAVRNPWRNATMHVETIYAPHEALHILRCSAFFMSKLHTLCDENGEPKIAAPDLRLA